MSQRRRWQREGPRHAMRCRGRGLGGVSGGVWNASAQTLVQKACLGVPQFVTVQGGQRRVVQPVLCSVAEESRQRRWKRRQCRRTHVVFAASADPTTLFLSDTLVRPDTAVRLAARGRLCFTRK